MKSAPFEYYRPDTLEEALAVLRELGDEAKVLAGGQSLVPMLNFRLAKPAGLVDIGEVNELVYRRYTDSGLALGSRVTHRVLETGDHARNGYEILNRTASLVGHRPIRTRGTIGGSLAHGDAAAEWCLLAAVLGTQIVVAGPNGRRTIPATEFFQGAFETALAPDELIVEVDFPLPSRQVGINEVARRHGDFAVTAAAVELDVRHDMVRAARVGLAGVADTVVRVPEAEQVLVGASVDGAHPAVFREAAYAASRAVSPHSDLHASADLRRRLAGVLVERSLTDAHTGRPHVELGVS